MASAAARRAEFRILEREVGPKEDIQPKQWIWIIGLTRATGRNVLCANPGTSFTVKRQLLDASAHARMARGVVLHRVRGRSNDVGGIVNVTLEVPHFAHATRMLEIPYVARRKRAAA